MSGGRKPRVALHWSKRTQTAEGAVFDDGMLRVERVAASSLIDGAHAMLGMLAPRDGFECHFTRALDQPLGRGDSRSAIAELLRVRRATLLPNDRGAILGTVESTLAYVAALRRRLDRFIMGTFTSAGGALIATSATRRIAAVACDPAMLNDRIEGCLGDVEAPQPLSSQALVALLDRTQIAQHLETWIAVGEAAGAEAAAHAGVCGAHKIIFPGHAGAAPTVGMLLADGHIRLERVWQGEANIPGDPLLSPEIRLREVFRELLDEVAARVTQLGYDIDDVECSRRVLLDSSGRRIDIVPLPTFTTIDEIESLSRSGEKQKLVGAEVSAIIDLPKPVLPPTAFSSTIRGAGVPDDRIVLGPGKMLACLCEIDVPAGWRAEWEPCGDVVMTRV